MATSQKQFNVNYNDDKALWYVTKGEDLRAYGVHTFGETTVQDLVDLLNDLGAECAECVEGLKLSPAKFKKGCRNKITTPQHRTKENQRRLKRRAVVLLDAAQEAVNNGEPLEMEVTRIVVHLQLVKAPRKLILETLEKLTGKTYSKPDHQLPMLKGGQPKDFGMQAPKGNTLQTKVPCPRCAGYGESTFGQTRGVCFHCDGSGITRLGAALLHQKAPQYLKISYSQKDVGSKENLWLRSHNPAHHEKETSFSNA